MNCLLPVYVPTYLGIELPHPPLGTSFRPEDSYYFLPVVRSCVYAYRGTLL